MILLTWLTLGVIQPTTTGDAELMRYYDTLVRYTEWMCPGVRRKAVDTIEMIESIDIPKGIGVTWYYPWYSDIGILRKFWVSKEVGDEQRMMLVAHEVGHAWFDLDHTKWIGLMYPSLAWHLKAENAVAQTWSEECERQGLRFYWENGRYDLVGRIR